MKKLRLLTSILSAFALAAAGYFALFGKSEEVSIERGLNCLFAFVLFVSFLSLRISMIGAVKPNYKILVVAFVIIVLSAFQWMDSMLLESFGAYLLILLMILFGLSLFTQLNEASRFFRTVRILFFGTLTYLALLLLLPERTPIFFDIAFVLLTLSSIGALVTSRSAEPIS
ncbi:MAG: hypothetical protein ACI865_000912 [Flavobacteriaceae bacterium]|jgi:hypothetical protein